MGKKSKSKKSGSTSRNVEGDGPPQEVQELPPWFVAVAEPLDERYLPPSAPDDDLLDWLSEPNPIAAVMDRRLLPSRCDRFVSCTRYLASSRSVTSRKAGTRW